MLNYLHFILFHEFLLFSTIFGSNACNLFQSFIFFYCAGGEVLGLDDFQLAGYFISNILCYLGIKIICHVKYCGLNPHLISFS